MLRGYGSERDVSAGDVLFADGNENYDLIVLLAGTADIVKGYGQAGATVLASYGPSQFLGEIGVLTGQRAFLSAVATSPGRVLAVPVEQLRRVMAHEPGLSDLLLRTLLLRHSILMSRGTGLTLIGSRFAADTRRLLEVLARNRLVWTWLDLETSPEAEQILQGLHIPVSELPIIVVPGGQVLRNPGSRALLDALAISGDPGSHPSGACDLLDRIERDPGIAVWTSTQVTALTGTDRLEGVRLRQTNEPEDSELAVAGLFVFIGAKPGTRWLAGQLAQDKHGFLGTGADVPPAQLEDESRPPLFLETSRPGIFAVGDVRSGSVKRVAAAIGEGSVAVRLVFERLQSEGTADPIGP